MPQDIPVEASETLAFVPASLEHLPGAPKFTLRSPSSRSKRYYRRLLREEGIQQHDRHAFRAEVLNGLRTLWTSEAFAEHSPRLKAFWDAQDDYALQLKDDPDLEWQWDSEEEARISALIAAITRAHAPLRKLAADNAEAAEMVPILLIAVAVGGWTGLDAAPRLVGGYLTVESVEAARDALAKFEKANGLVDKDGQPTGTAFRELFVAASKRMYLDEEEEKNSVSPSPSGNAPQSSRTGTGGTNGKSRASASSKKTRAGE